MHHGEYKVNVVGVLIFVYRPLTYVSSLMVQLVYVHSTKCLSAFKAGNYVKFMSVMHVPNYLFSWQDAACFVRILSLVSMLILMPILWCMGKTDDIFNTACDAASVVQLTYSGFSMPAVFIAHSCIGSSSLQIHIQSTCDP